MPSRGVEVDDVVREAKQADMFVWARTHGYAPEGDAHGMLRRIEDSGVPTVGVHLDLYWGIPRREAEIGRHPWWTCQWMFTADGGPRPWAAKGVARHRWLPPPLGVSLHRRGMITARYLTTAVFVGGYVPDIHGQHRRDLLTWAARTWRDRFVRYGRGRQIWGDQLAHLYASAQVAVGDSARASHYWSDRLIRTLGVGGLLAHPLVEGMDELGFTDDVLIRYRWGRYAEILQRFEAMSEQDRQAMRDAAYTVVGDRHLWTHRLQQIAADVLGTT